MSARPARAPRYVSGAVMKIVVAKSLAPRPAAGTVEISDQPA
ncbi:hypothetical protein ACNHKD_01300 [Methylocystis sp. JAN1]